MGRLAGGRFLSRLLFAGQPNLQASPLRVSGPALLVYVRAKWTRQIAASLWGVAMALYMISFISYGATLVFYAAAFPRLARNTQHSRDLREKLDHGEISVEVYEREESLEKNRVSNISTVGSSCVSWRTFG